MGRWVYLVQTACSDEGKETEFLEWYEKMHLPDFLKQPAFTRATLYVNDERVPSEGKYLCVWEIETDDINKTWEFYAEYTKGLRAQGRIFPHKLVSRSLWRQLRPSQEKRPGS
ncbi:MAG: hypothetical protein HYX92_20665 [Chloroflexi bacterium]|nr:hypothetical protein [Chloroflexota bacterium]